jgi:hypothetical protein
MEKQKELIVIAAIFLVVVLAIGSYGWFAGEHRKVCVSKCLEALNLSFIESDYFSGNCYCVYMFNDTRIKMP